MPAVTTQEAMEAVPEAASIHRPASGLSIDPRRLIWWRESRGWSRANLSDAITEMHLTDDDGAELTVTRDAIAKIENGERKPKPRTVQALCAALSRVRVPVFDELTGVYTGDVWREAEEPCTPRDLMPGGTPLAPHLQALARKSRLAHNLELREFALRYGIRYRNPESGRVYYSKPLQAAYELEASGAPREDVRRAVILAGATRPDPDPEDTANPQDGESPGLGNEERLAS